MAERHPSGPAAPADHGAYKTVRRTRQTPVTIDGITYDVDHEYDERVPLPPRDWQLIGRRVAVTGTALVVAASLAWTTASIGGLLALAVAAPIAYAAASVFDISWVVCMLAEWLARYDPDRAKLARNAGWIALAVSVAAVGVHGWVVAGSIEAGCVGAVVSVLAKGLWTVVMRLTTYPMDTVRRRWLAAHRAHVGTQLAMMLEMRELDRAEAFVAADRAARRLPGHAIAQTPAPEPARRTARATEEPAPDGDVEDITDHLADAGIRIDQNIAREAQGHARANAGHARTSPDSTSAAILHINREENTSIADVVRRCLDNDLTNVDRVLAVAHRHLPGAKDDSVRRELQRALSKRARDAERAAG